VVGSEALPSKVEAAVERAREREVVDEAEEEVLEEKEEEIKLWHERLRLLIESVDTAIYLVVAVVFVVGAVAMLGYTVYTFAQQANSNAGFASAVVNLINDLLLVMIMMEVLKTILSYLEEHAISLRPFLFVGVISATRRILTVGAAVAVEQNLTHTELWMSLDDLLVNAGVILALSIAIRLVGTPLSDGK
jgi:uncharacterized membrane protein (DUF373 family)